MSETTIQAAQAANDPSPTATGGTEPSAAPAAQNAVNWEGIPECMRALPQWCVAGLSKAPRSPRSGLPPASVNDPNSWGTFDHAATLAWRQGIYIGFVLTETDPFCCIDLDVKPDTTPEEIARHGRIVQHFDSWTERSRSGLGLHVWLLGTLPDGGRGARRDGVEVYSQQRFIIVTGNTLLDRPVADRQDLLEILVAEIRGQQASDHTVLAPEQLDFPESRTVAEIWSRCTSASNAERFLALWYGNWRQVIRDNGKPAFPSQSEADLGLVTHLLFNDATNAQCLWMWQQSALCPSKRPSEKRKANPMTYMRNTITKARQHRVNDKLRAAELVKAFASLTST